MKVGSGKNSTSGIVTGVIMPIEKFLLTHPWIGWIAFLVVLGIFAVFIIWQYLIKSRITQRTLSDVKKACDADSAKEILLSVPAGLSRSGGRAIEYHKICSDSESPGPNEYVRSTPSYLFSGINSRTTNVPIARRKDSRVCQATIPRTANLKAGWPRDALRQIYPSDISSLGSDSSRSYSRPPSYREMRRSATNSPSVISPYSGF